MSGFHLKSVRSAALSGCAAIALAIAAPVVAQSTQSVDFDIEAQNLDAALSEYARQSRQQMLFAPEIASGKRSGSVKGELTPLTALDELLVGTGLGYAITGEGAILVGDPIEVAVRAAEIDGRLAENDGPQGGTVLAQAETETSTGRTREKIIVTGQKREEYIQDVPIAISAFTMEELNAQKIEGGFDLLKAIPNVSFTKTNFTSYNFQIRGIGTQATSATTDPGVAVAFNNTSVIQNRLFEQEYLDVERVEVLRGPQGTLYGRNATAGVINVISAKPVMEEWLGEAKIEAGNYDTKRLRGMLNIPIGDSLAVRGAFAGTSRDGYTYNATTDNRIDGRELWTGRVTVGWEPDPRFRANLIWEHFNEDDNRLRTGKQLCHRDDGPTDIGGFPIPISGVGFDDDQVLLLKRAFLSQGCKPGSLYTDEAYGTPNGLSYGFVLGAITPTEGVFDFVTTSVGIDPDLDDGVGDSVSIIKFGDPYGGKMQSRDLREISSILDPVYRAEADVVELNIDFDLTDSLTFSSQTAYVDDETYSFQDFNRFNTEPVFTDTSEGELWYSSVSSLPSVYEEAAPGGVFCDPQIGCSDTIAGFDIAQASASQFSQELRLQSEFGGPFNFSLGANYTEFDVLVDYYIMFNLITAMASIGPFNAPVGSKYAQVGGSDVNAPYDPTVCPWSDFFRGTSIPAVPVPTSDPNSACPYIDPNPIDHSKNFEGDGHNYFRSKNPYELESWAAFGEVYWNLQDALKLTVGLRYTDDRKSFVNVPSQVLLAPSYMAGGTVAKGYPDVGTIEQKWGEWTGRLVLDWQPELDFTDETLVYGSFSRGYKGGGANPPRPGFATTEELRAISVEQGTDADFDFLDAFLPDFFPVLEITADEYGETFEPEFVNAYELGSKNTLLGGALTLNTTAFYYDYEGYQVSQIRDRTAVNENFDATMWGLELETILAPSEDLQFLANIGYLNTKIADGEMSIDIMNRTAGNPDYMVVKPWAQLPSNCVLPTDVVVANRFLQPFNWVSFCGVGGLLGSAVSKPVDPNFGNTRYDPANYPILNGGAGLFQDLGGNELPNAPHWTTNIGMQYGRDVLDGSWRVTFRSDAYWQSQSYHRVYNFEPYDKLRGWYNVNVAVKAANEDLGIETEFYVKNLLDKSPITGAFLNSDDTGLTTNVFMLDPRLVGFSVRKTF